MNDLDPSSDIEAKQRVDPESEVVAYLKGRSAPCPRCGYNLRDIPSAKCPECGEPLVLKVGSPRGQFGWLVVAMAPGCFSGVAATFVLVPIVMTIVTGASLKRNVPLPVLAADIFGFVSAASVLIMYRHRQTILSWSTRQQRLFALAVWGVHVLTFALFLFGMWLLA